MESGGFEYYKVKAFVWLKKSMVLFHMKKEPMCLQ